VGSLQLRLFLSYFVIIAVTLTLFAVSLFLLLGGYRDSITYESLEDLAGLVATQADSEVRGLTDGADPNGQPPTVVDLVISLRESLLGPADDGVSDVASIAIVDAEGRVIPGGFAGTTGESAVALDQARVSNIDLPDDPRTSQPCRLEVPGEGSLLCVSVRLSDTVLAAFPGTEAAGLVVAQPASSRSDVLSDLMPRLFFSGLIGVAAALILGFLLSQSVAAPLRNIARASRNVAAGNFRQRVPVTGPPEVRNLAADFNQMTGEVQRSQQTLRDFLMNISHELKTPLTSIRGFSDALLDGTIDDQKGIERSARIINDESNRVLRLVTELLDLSRMESGQISMAQEELNLEELLTHTRDVFALRSEETGTDLSLYVGTPGPVQGDFERLEQVLNNLLDNAFRHTPRGGVITVSTEEAEPGVALVMVSDTGPGVPKAALPHLFDRFYRATEDGARDGTRSYGLGLAISREIIRAHQGEIWATSREEAGTTFAFTLPIARPGARRVVSRSPRSRIRPSPRRARPTQP